MAERKVSKRILRSRLYSERAILTLIAAQEGKLSTTRKGIARRLRIKEKLIPEHLLAGLKVYRKIHLAWGQMWDILYNEMCKIQDSRKTKS
jgi:DNA-binding transcriptional regulator PaaX